MLKVYLASSMEFSQTTIMILMCDVPCILVYDVVIIPTYAQITSLLHTHGECM